MATRALEAKREKLQSQALRVSPVESRTTITRSSRRESALTLLFTHNGNRVLVLVLEAGTPKIENEDENENEDAEEEGTCPLSPAISPAVYVFSAERGHSCPQQRGTRNGGGESRPYWRPEAAADKNVRAPLHTYPAVGERELGSWGLGSCLGLAQGQEAR